MLLVPSPCEIQRHPTSSVFIASSVRQTPPPAAPTQSRHGPSSSQVGEMAIAATRPDTVLVLPESGSWMLVSGPSDVQTASVATRPRYAIPRNTQYFSSDARINAGWRGVAG